MLHFCDIGGVLVCGPETRCILFYFADGRNAILTGHDQINQDHIRPQGLSFQNDFDAICRLPTTSIPGSLSIRAKSPLRTIA